MDNWYAAFLKAQSKGVKYKWLIKCEHKGCSHVYPSNSLRKRCPNCKKLNIN